jgi:acetyl esterase/lipase
MTGAHPPIDPEVNATIQLLRAEYREDFWTPDKIPLMRELWAAYAPDDDQLRQDSNLLVEKIAFAGPPEAPAIEGIVVRPKRPGPWPCVLHLHGGGLIGGDARAGLDYVVAWAMTFGMTIVSVNYRLAPEHPFPAAIEDCYASLLWVADHAVELDIDLNRMMVTGASAGGGLAAATALMARDQQGPDISNLVLVSPMLDDRQNTPSSKYLGIPWDMRSNETAWTAFLGDRRAGENVSQYAAPGRAVDLRGMPSTYIDVGSVEVFRDESLEFAARLAAADVPVELHVWGGAPHGYDAYAPQSELARAASAARISFMRRVLGDGLEHHER